QCRVTEPLVRFAVDLIGAAFDRDVDRAAHRVAQGCIERGRLNLELADRELRRRKSYARLRSIGIRVRYAIDREFVLIVAPAVRGECGRSIVETRFAKAKVGSVDGAGRQMYQVQGIARELR